MASWADTLRREIEKGGDQPPCPFCRVPRVKRSTYTRCCRCGINWEDGEDLSRDPREGRRKKSLELALRARGEKTKPPSQDNGAAPDRRRA